MPAFGQTFESHDLAVIGLLIVLEGVLSLDNAMVLGLLARRLPVPLRNKALAYGLAGAFVFRTVAVISASLLLKITWMKLLGGAYLLYMAAKHFVSPDPSETPSSADATPPTSSANPNSTHRWTFWRAVIAIELTDIAFAVDSIIAAMGVIGSPPPNHPADQHHPKLWVVIVGGILGVILMRFAAAAFVKLLEKFPRLETSAYLLVGVIGLKLVLDWYFNPPGNLAPHTLDFHHASHWAFWAFWGAMILSFLVGFIPHRPTPAQPGSR
jgi:YkoY family integral membrane protein